MLKAYKVEDIHDDEGEAVIVYAEKASEAKAAALRRLTDPSHYMALRARRAYFMDGTEGLTPLNRQLRLFDYGWHYEYDDKYYSQDNRDEFIHLVNEGYIKKLY